MFRPPYRRARDNSGPVRVWRVSGDLALQQGDSVYLNKNMLSEVVHFMIAMPQRTTYLQGYLSKYVCQ